ncbi:MAG: dihydroneopterin aldolase [Lentisphaerae bacterium]|nr:dihydroneopterin aldolase [Lentisphaerota bacterium]
MYIRDLELSCIIGTKPEERKARQNVIINLTFECDLALAGSSDDLNDTINYKTISDNVVAMVNGSSFFLLEKLACGIADICLRDKRVRAVTVTVDKPAALISAKSAAVEIRKEND